MNTRFTALLLAGLAGLMLSGQASADPRFMDRDFSGSYVSEERVDREYGKREERDARKVNRKRDRKNERKAEDQEHDRGYGYGYERRNPHPIQDDRGRR